MLKKLVVALSFSFVASVVVISSSQATPIYATEVTKVSSGTGYVAPSRMSADNAEGEADGHFFSMGVGGMAVYDFGTLFDTTATIVEVTNGSRANYVETANIYAYSGAAITDFSGLTSFTDDEGKTLKGWTFITSITNALEETNIALPGGPFRYLGIWDTSKQIGSSRDGFDVDAISVNPVPEPATMLLFGTGLVGLAGVLRRKKSSNPLIRNIKVGFRNDPTFFVL